MDCSCALCKESLLFFIKVKLDDSLDTVLAEYARNTDAEILFTIFAFKKSRAGDYCLLVVDFIDFHNTFYVPNNAVLTIVGDFNVAEAKKLVHDYFNDIPAGAPVIQPAIQEPAQKAEVRDTAYDNIQMPALIMAYHIPGMTSDDFYTVSMLNTLLAQGQSSRLYSTIVNDKQMAMELAAMPLPLEHPGLSIILGLPNMNVQLNDLEHEID